MQQVRATASLCLHIDDVTQSCNRAVYPFQRSMMCHVCSSLLPATLPASLQDQQDGLGAELAGMLQSPAGDAGGGDDLYDPEDF